jgi:hypothetical protein
MSRLKKTAALYLAMTMAVFALFTTGCKKSSNPAAATVVPITVDIFPLTVGHSISYTGYLRAMGTDSNVTSTVYSSSWTVVSNNAATPLGGTSNLVIDSITAPAPSAESLYILREPPTGDANFSFIQNVSYMGADTLVWVLAGDSQDGVGAYWHGFVDSSRSGDSTFGLWIVGHFADEESLSVGGQAFDTYRLAITTDNLIDSLVTGEPDIPMATYWFSPGIGPVKIIVNATKQSNGYEWDYKSRNF